MAFLGHVKIPARFLKLKASVPEKLRGGVMERIGNHIYHLYHLFNFLCPGLFAKFWSKNY